MGVMLIWALKVHYLGIFWDFVNSLWIQNQKEANSWRQFLTNCSQFDFRIYNWIYLDNHCISRTITKRATHIPEEIHNLASTRYLLGNYLDLVLRWTIIHYQESYRWHRSDNNFVWLTFNYFKILQAWRLKLIKIANKKLCWLFIY